MSTYLLNISSDDRRSTSTTDDFSIAYQPPPSIPGNWMIALESFSMWYSYYNIAPNYDNQTFKYYNGSTWKTITITPGLYTIPDLNNFLLASMKANGDSGTDVNNNDVFYITLTPNYNTFKLLISISNGYQVDLTDGYLYEMLGFEPIVINSSQEGVNNVNITNGVNRILIHVDCVVGSYKGSSAADILYSFNPDGAPSSLIQIKPNRLIWLPINKTNYLTDIRLYITDQQGRRIDLNGEEVSCSLVLKRAR